VRLALVTLVVDDYDRAIAFYRDTLGFELVTDDQLDGTKRWVVVRPPGAETGLLLARAVDARQRAHVGDQTVGRVAFFLTTDDFGREHARLVDAQVQFVESPRTEAYGTVAVFEDLYGNRWDLLGPR
jgi:catechol 2,3-dioxygenase-like lactoylglutathione lyase family enzyme